MVTLQYTRVDKSKEHTTSKTGYVALYSPNHPFNIYM